MTFWIASADGGQDIGPTHCEVVRPLDREDGGEWLLIRVNPPILSRSEGGRLESLHEVLMAPQLPNGHFSEDMRDGPMPVVIYKPGSGTDGLTGVTVAVLHGSKLPSARATRLRQSWPVLLIMPFLIWFVASLAYSTRFAKPVSAAVAHFHTLFAAREDDVIYEDADESWKSSVDLDSYHRLFDQIRTKLGRCDYAPPTNWYVNTYRGATLVTVGTHSECDGGLLHETFVWRIVGGNPPKLAGYSAQSPALSTW